MQMMGRKSLMVIAQPVVDQDTVLVRHVIDTHNITGVEEIKYHYPFFTIIICIIVAIIFVWGIYDSKEQFFWMYTVSPPYRTWWFFEVDSWTEGCTDRRSEAYRFFSLQFVHSGIPHIGLNLIALLFYGSCFESFQGPAVTLLVFELSVSMGALGQNFYNPYGSLVGCSAGVYGLIGANLGNVLINYESFDSSSFHSIFWTIVGQLFIDGFLYIFWFNPTFGYAAHFAGFWVGFFTTLSLATVYLKSKLQRIASTISFIMLFVMIIYACTSYAQTWPPHSHNDLVIHKVNKDSCCEDMFQLMMKLNVGASTIRERYYCNGINLIEDK